MILMDEKKIMQSKISILKEKSNVISKFTEKDDHENCWAIL